LEKNKLLTTFALTLNSLYLKHPMKKTLISFTAAFGLLFGSCASLQLPTIPTTIGAPVDLTPTQTEIAGGLKDALIKGIQTGVGVLSVKDGFFGSPDWKILLPQEVTNLESRMRMLGFGRQFDASIKALNEGAEMATSEARDVFIQAIRDMTIQDAMGILKGGNGSATRYLKQSSTATLTERFSPIISRSLEKVDATRYWGDVSKAYNTITGAGITTDLTGYVTEHALRAIFSEVEKQENLVRENPVQRTTDLMKKVFNYADQQR
jgi:hypothetical protein